MKYVKSTSIILIVLSLPFLFRQYSQMKETSVRYLDKHGEVHVLSLSVKDKERLYCFMRMLFAEDNFAYTLLGSKPVSWASYHNPFPFVDLSTFRYSFNKYQRTMRLGWEAWSKYRHLFPSVAFWIESPKSRPGAVSILIVNEEQFNHVVTSNKQDFQNVLRREITDGFQLLKEAKDGSLMHEILEGHQALMGMVLGYGRENSWKFLESCKKKVPLCCVWDETNDRVPGEIRTRLGAIDIEGCLALESCPSFAGDPNSEESLALKKEYLLTKQKVIDYYKGKDFLEATLSLLAGYRPPDNNTGL